ncbi:hypothetical protein DH09_07520 [Bacillaceae bacterium JMAK1]|nr:hypothetical protein DH09_07520 [Bacillaceae bacterium JMAK1]
MKRLNRLILFVFLIVIPPELANADNPNDRVANLALEMVGDDHQGFLTSEFVQHVYEEANGVYIPSYAREQQQMGQDIERSDLQSGDVVFFQGSSLMSGIYINEGRFVIVTSEGISERNFNHSDYWSDAYSGAARFSQDEETDPAAELALENVGDNDQRLITSEFVQFIYEEAKGISLPRAATDQWIEGSEVEQLQSGDVVFFQGSFLMSGIYIGNGQFVIVTSEGIVLRNMETSSYYQDRYVGAKRYDGDSPPSTDHDIVQLARELIGTSYNRSGSSPEEGFNSGSFVYYVYKEITGSWLSKRTPALYEAGMEVDREELQSGDLVFFENDDAELISGIYSEDNQFVIASSSGVEERHLDYNTYYSDRYVGAVRYTDDRLEKSNPMTYEEHENPIVREAMNYIGTPYLMTGSTLDAFDCSFFVQMVFREALDVHLPRISYKQWEVGETMLPEGTDIDDVVLDEELRPGDVLYFSGTWQEDISHTAIYLGEDYIIHATGEEGQTTISYMSDYWRDHFTGAKRFDDLTIQYDNEAIFEAYQLLGTDYKQGGTAPDDGFDTGGFVQYVYNEAYHYELPRFGREQWEEGTEVSIEAAEPGDLLFFQGSSIIPALYIGNNQMIVTTVSNGVTVIDLTTSEYWPPRLLGARTYDTDIRDLEVVQIARSYIDEPFDDTSATFMQQPFDEASGIELPGNIDDLQQTGESIHVEELNEGDLLFFENPKLVGIYTGDGQFITVVQDRVSEQSLDGEQRWIDRFVEGRTMNDV